MEGEWQYNDEGRRAEEGAFSLSNGSTDEKGNFTTTYTAPKIDSEQIFIIEVKAKKDRYIDGEGTFEVIVEKDSEEVNVWMYVILVIICSIIIVMTATVHFNSKIEGKRKGGF